MMCPLNPLTWSASTWKLALPEIIMGTLAAIAAVALITVAP